MRHLVLSVILLGALTVPGIAQDPGEEPDHGVARLSLIGGDVTVRRGDSGEDIAAEPNAPLVARDHVFTERGARAEIQLDWANIVRLAPDTEVRMALLADRNFRVELAGGTMTFRVLRDSNAQVEISTPTASIRPKQQGTYRITVRDDFSTEITVRSGESDVFVGRDYSPLRSGQTLIVKGDPANPERNFVGFLPHDDWDSWNDSRDRDLERSDSYKYVSRDIYGADDLYGHGRWIYDPPYGWVWAPNVAANWAPYRDGRWYHADYYGWTWVSADPWGWAPYHYGRWYQAPRHGWVWYPGGAAPRHYWRPALVSFIGWGGNIGFNVAFGFGNVGWVPLAPYEPYRPWYGRNVSAGNFVNNVSVINTYRNARFVNGYSGVTSIGVGDFGRQRTTVNNYVSANERDLSRAGDVRGRVPFEPTRDARRLSDRQVVARNDGRRNNDNRQFVVSRPDNSRQVSQPSVQPNATMQSQARQDVWLNTRQVPQKNSRVFGGQPAQATTQPSQPNQSNRPERINAPAGAVPPPQVPSRREEAARSRQPEFVVAPLRSPAVTNRGVGRAAEAPRAQERRPESRSSQPAPAPANPNRGQGRGRR